MLSLMKFMTVTKSIVKVKFERNREILSDFVLVGLKDIVVGEHKNALMRDMAREKEEEEFRKKSSPSNQED